MIPFLIALMIPWFLPLLALKIETNRFKAEQGGSLCIASTVGKTILIRQHFAAGVECS